MIFSHLPALTGWYLSIWIGFVVGEIEPVSYPVDPIRR